MRRAVVVGLFLVAWVAASATASAKTITVVPGDDWTKIESAQPGDVVEIAPGTYKFRVDLSTPGTATDPITVRAQDPANRPVWDLTGTAVSLAPGSYTAGDKGRGCWQVHGGHYVIDGIVFRGCHDDSSSGLRVVNVPDVRVRNCLFVDNTNGLIGAGDPIVIEHSEFDRNALPQSPLAHQIYIYGGTLEVRFSYFHDAVAGQDFHVRARDALVEYNWITRPASYLGDLMSCEYLCGGTGTAPITQRMMLRGNVLVQGTPDNHSQLVVLYNDGGPSSDATGGVSRMELTMVSNTVIGTAGFNNAAVHLVNDTIETSANLVDNLFVDFKQLVLIDSAATLNTTVDGSGNWVTTGTDPGTLSVKTGADPMLGPGYVPLPGSPVIGAATDPGALAPTYEYYRDETVTAEGRARPTVHDIGAFESGNDSPPFGGTGPTPTTDGGISGGGGTIGGGGGGGGGTPIPNSGCGCDVGGADRSSLTLALALLLVCGAVGYARRRRRA